MSLYDCIRMYTYVCLFTCHLELMGSFFEIPHTGNRRKDKDVSGAVSSDMLRSALETINTWGRGGKGANAG